MREVVLSGASGESLLGWSKAVGLPKLAHPAFCAGGGRTTEFEGLSTDGEGSRPKRFS